jgi:hypothetical protein
MWFFKDKSLRKFLGITPKNVLEESGLLAEQTRVMCSAMAAINADLQRKFKEGVTALGDLRDLQGQTAQLLSDTLAELGKLREFLGIRRYEKTQADRQIFTETGVLPDILDKFKIFKYKMEKHFIKE